MATRNIPGNNDSEHNNIILLNGEPSYISNIACGCAYRLPKEKKVLLVSSIGNSFQTRLNQGIIRKKSKNPLFSIDNPFEQLEKSIIETDLENLDLLPGLDNYCVKGKLHENERLIRDYTKSLEDLKDSNKYHSIIVEDGNRFDSLRVSNLANRHYFFLDGEDAKLDNQLNRINQALFARIEEGFVKHFPDAKVFISNYDLDRVARRHSSLLNEMVNEKRTAESVKIYSDFKTVEETLHKVIDKSKEELKESDPYFEVYFEINRLLRGSEDSLDALFKGINVMNKAKFRDILDIVINHSVNSSRVSLFYLPQDPLLLKETANSGFPLLWHKYNKSNHHEKAENSELAKSLERSIDFILNGRPKNLTEIIPDKDENCYFRGEFDEGKKQYIKNIRDSIDRVYTQDRIQYQTKKLSLISSFVRPSLLILSCLGILAGTSALYNYANNKFNQQNNLSLFLLERTKKHHNENIGKLEIKKQENAKKAEEAEKKTIIKQKEEQEKTLRAENERKTGQQRAEQERARKEAGQKEKKASEEKSRKEKIKLAQQGMWRDKTFLSELEKMLEENGTEVFNTDDILSKNYQIKTSNNEIEIQKDNDVLFYPLEDNEFQRLNELKIKYIKSRLK